VVSNQRERIIDSLAHVCADKGYRATTVEDVIAHAGVSRRTFYDLFQDKRDCFLVAYELVMERLYGAVEAAYWAGERPWPQRMASGLTAMLEQLAAEPVLARLALVEVLAAGRDALERRDAHLKRFETFFGPARSGLPATLDEPQLLARAVVGGLSEALYTRVVNGDTDRLLDVAADVLYCVLVPYVGHGDAAAASAGLSA
jgi:AcrR family transcriptional regulator